MVDIIILLWCTCTPYIQCVVHVRFATCLTGTNQPESAAESNICIVSAPGSPGMAIQDSPTFPSRSFLKTAVSLSTNVDTEHTEAALMQETAALLASLSDVILSPAKAPKMDRTQQSYEVCNESEV